MGFAFAFDATRCTGCKTCMMACKDANNLSVDINYRSVFEYEFEGTWHQDACGGWSLENGRTFYTSLSCNHCKDASCLHVCPTGAMHREDNGIVRVNTTRCIGCGYCELSCPYHAPKVDYQEGHSSKCDGCYDRVVAGKPPVCVEACTQRALGYGDADDLEKAFSTIRDLNSLPDSSLTQPQVFIKPPTWLDGMEGVPGHIVNRAEMS